MLAALPAGVFDKLTALTRLDLQRNLLAALPAGVFDELTALDALHMGANSLTALPDDVFDELTALTKLGLDVNSLTALPAGVFDKLTALDALSLENNSLTALPAGIFDELTALTDLFLFSNSLAELPDDVFEPLTSLSLLLLSDNPGAPFSPTAVALPDDGTVPPAGGTVMLDGSGSGGAWGTNVAYAWALTTPTSGVTVTFDSVAIAKPTVTIPQVTAGTDLVFTLTVTGRGGSDGISPGGPVTDTRPPLLTRATVNGDTLVLTYDETLDGASVPAPGAFAVTAAGSTVSANGVSVAGSAGDADAGECGAGQPDGDAGLYAGGEPDPGRGGQRRGAALRTGRDQQHAGRPGDRHAATAAHPGDGERRHAGAHLRRDPRTVRRVPAPGAFAVTAAGSTVSANGVSVAGSAVTLTLANAVQANQTVTLDYTPGANPIQDAAGNDAAPLSGQAVTNNTPGGGGGGGGGGTTDSGPTVTISTTASAEPVTGPFTVTVVFSESVNGFELSDLVVGNGVASDLQGNGTTFTATITPAASGTVTLDIPDGAAADDAGNESEAASRFSIAAELDTTAPTVTISTAASAPVNGPFTVTFTFSEEVTGFELSDLVVGNGSSSPLQGDGASYTATITPDASGTVTVDVPDGAASDSAGNPSVAAQQFSIVAELAPTVTITGPATEPVIGPFSITVIFSEPVTGFELEDVVVGNGVASELEGDGARYTATVTPTAPGPVTVDIAAGAAEDSAGNPSTAADQFSITVELTPVPALPLAGVIALAALLLIGVIRRRAGDRCCVMENRVGAVA